MVACFFYAAATSAAFAQSPSLYGISLKERIPLEECPKEKFLLGSDTLAYKKHYYNAPPCFESFSHVGATIRLQGLVMAKRNSMEVYFDKGLVERISFWTDGLDSQQENFEALKAKFGRPNKVLRPIAKNAFGVTFKLIEAEWRFKSALLKFTTNTGSIDSGLVELMTEGAASELRKQLTQPQRDDNL